MNDNRGRSADTDEGRIERNPSRPYENKPPQTDTPKKESLRSAQRITQTRFSRDMSGLWQADFAQLAMDGLPTTHVTTADEVAGGDLAVLLVGAGLAESKSQAHSWLHQEAITVNGQAAEDAQHCARHTVCTVTTPFCNAAPSNTRSLSRPEHG